jgi:hypothetical protein
MNGAGRAFLPRPGRAAAACCNNRHGRGVAAARRPPFPSTLPLSDPADPLSRCHCRLREIKAPEGEYIGLGVRFPLAPGAAISACMQIAESGACGLAIVGAFFFSF